MKGGQAMIGFLAGLKRLYNLRDLERRLLLARVPVNGICVEIGVDRGLHARCILDLCIPNLLLLVAPWEGRGVDAVDVTHAFGCGGRTTVAQTTSMNFARYWTGHPDFVYIDGDHSSPAVRKDVVAWGTLLAAGGVLAGDDYQQPGVRKGVADGLRELRVAAGCKMKKVGPWRTQWAVEKM